MSLAEQFEKIKQPKLQSQHQVSRLFTLQFHHLLTREI
jgi:hypothetical protein